MPVYAVVRGDKVENIVLWDGKTGWTPPDGSFAVRVCDEDVPPAGSAGIGWDYVDGQFVDTRPQLEPEYG